MKEMVNGEPRSATYVRIPDQAFLLLLLWAVTLTCGIVSAQSVPQNAPPPDRNIAAPGPQAHSPQTQRQPLSPGAKAPQPIRQMVGSGTIEGFVYWDTGAISHVPAGDCGGLAVNVAVAQSSAGPYTPLATLSNNFKYVGQVKQFLVGGKNKVYDVCTYGYGKVPVGLNLQVTVNVASPSAFSPASVPQNSIISPINIINAQCDMLPRIVNPTAADLFSKWGTCQNMAFDVNFEIQPSAHLLSSGVIQPHSASTPQGALLAAPQPRLLTPGAAQNGGTAKNAQVNQSTNTATPGSNLKSNKFLASAMSHVSALDPANSMPGMNADNSAVLPVLRKQSLAAQSLIASSSGPVQNNNGSSLSGGSSQMLNSQMSPNGSSPQIGASQIMSSPGSASSGVSNARTVPPTMQQAPTSSVPARVQQPSTVGTNEISSQACTLNIATVDGEKSGVWFSPLSGPDGTFIIQGCGFGTTPGQIYLSGLHYATVSASSAPMGSSLAPDQIGFQVASGNWSDRKIVAQIDPNASGFYDTNNITLIIKTANGQVYQAAGFNFSAARADQVLTSILKAPSCWTSQNGCIPAGINLASANSVNGQVQADAESPSVSMFRPGETIALSRQSLVGQFPIPAAPGLSFPGSTDVYQFKFAPGFQLDPHTGVQLQHTTLDSSYCQSVNGVPAKSGSWAVNYLSTSSFQVSWEEEGCWPQSSLTSASTQQWLEYGSVSAYALDITVLGPRGVSPWPSGKTNVLTIQTHQQLLTH